MLQCVTVGQRSGWSTKSEQVIIDLTLKQLEQLLLLDNDTTSEITEIQKEELIFFAVTLLGVALREIHIGVTIRNLLGVHMIVILQIHSCSLGSASRLEQLIKYGSQV